MKHLEHYTTEKIRSGINIPSYDQCVEELILNSLDAKATYVEVIINPLDCAVTVSDDGIGIDVNDFHKVGAYRYSTSKMSENINIESITTSGFRGEALASIVNFSSHVTIISRHKNSKNGYCQKFENSRSIYCGRYDSFRSIGTTIEVQGLFHSIPARSMDIKMHKDRELLSVRSKIESLALILPRVAFKLSYNVSQPSMNISTLNSSGNASNVQQTSLSLSRHSSFSQRIRAILSSKVDQMLILPKISNTEDQHVSQPNIMSGIEVQGAVSDPSTGRAPLGVRVVGLNGRLLEASSPVHACIDSIYKKLLATKGFGTANRLISSPAFILAIQVPTSVSLSLVHEPSKKNIQMADLKPLLQAVSFAIHSAINRSARPNVQPTAGAPANHAANPRPPDIASNPSSPCSPLQAPVDDWESIQGPASLLLSQSLSPAFAMSPVSHNQLPGGLSTAQYFLNTSLEIDASPFVPPSVLFKQTLFEENPAPCQPLHHATSCSKSSLIARACRFPERIHVPERPTRIVFSREEEILPAMSPSPCLMRLSPFLLPLSQPRACELDLSATEHPARVNSSQLCPLPPRAIKFSRDDEIIAFSTLKPSSLLFQRQHDAAEPQQLFNGGYVASPPIRSEFPIQPPRTLFRPRSPSPPASPRPVLRQSAMFLSRSQEEPKSCVIPPSPMSRPPAKRIVRNPSTNSISALDPAAPCSSSASPPVAFSPPSPPASAKMNFPQKVSISEIELNFSPCEDEAMLDDMHLVESSRSLISFARSSEPDSKTSLIPTVTLKHPITASANNGCELHDDGPSSKEILLPKDMFSNLKVISQVENKFIVALYTPEARHTGSSCTASPLLIAVDQHALAERVRLEYLLANPPLPHEILLSHPIKVPLTPFEFAAVSIKFAPSPSTTVIHRFFGFSFRVLSSPPSLLVLSESSYLGSRIPTEELLNILLTPQSGMPPVLRRLLVSKSCRSAIKFGDSLTPSQIQLLVANGSATSFPFQCAHGRPTAYPLAEVQSPVSKLRAVVRNISIDTSNFIDVRRVTRSLSAPAMVSKKA